MAKQRKDHVDKLLLEGLEENELVLEMVKKFGFDVLMDQSKEQGVRDYIKDQASENPPRACLHLGAKAAQRVGVWSPPRRHRRFQAP